jgi:hypothetical protein
MHLIIIAKISEHTCYLSGHLYLGLVPNPVANFSRDCPVLKKKENNQNPVANFSRRLYKKNKIFAGNIMLVKNNPSFLANCVYI